MCGCHIRTKSHSGLGEGTRAAVPEAKQTLGTDELSSYIPMAAMWGKDQADARDSRWQTQD